LIFGEEADRPHGGIRGAAAGMNGAASQSHLQTTDDLPGRFERPQAGNRRRVGIRSERASRSGLSSITKEDEHGWVQAKVAHPLPPRRAIE